MSSNSEPLNCETFEDRIHQILDDRLTLTGDPLLMDHAAHCTPCENKLHEYDAVEDSIKILKDDMDKILEGIDTRKHKRSIAQRPLALIATMAAALLVCVSAINWFAADGNPNQNSSVAKKVESKQTNPAPILGSTLGVIDVKDPNGQPSYRSTPDTSPFSPNFSVARSIPRIPTASNWTHVSSKIQPVLSYSSELPGVRATQCSIQVTIELFLKSLRPESKSKPDLGTVMDFGPFSMA